MNAVLPHWGPEFRIELDNIFGPLLTSSGSIFRFHGKDVRNYDCCGIGQRIPALWTTGNRGQLYVSTQIDDNGNRVITNEVGSLRFQME